MGYAMNPHFEARIDETRQLFVHDCWGKITQDTPSAVHGGATYVSQHLRHLRTTALTGRIREDSKRSRVGSPASLPCILMNGKRSKG